MGRTETRELTLGERQAADTLRRMAAIIRHAAGDRRVILVARAIVADVNGRDQVGQARAIRRWLADRLRFVRDPVGIELLSQPTYLLGVIAEAGYVQGDCDDAATLGATLARAIGLRCELRAVAYDSRTAQYSHVYAIVLTPMGAVDLDTTSANHDQSVARETRVIIEEIL